MEKKSTSNGTSGFLKTDGGKTKSNAIEVPSIALPKGGGAIKGIDEKFSVNAVNGTASFSIPLPVAAARGVAPALSLSYNSGGGNGIFGLGWSLGLPSIKRKTDKGLPQYLDAVESDTFLFSEAEDLVPMFQKKTDGSFDVDTLTGEYKIKESDYPNTLKKTHTIRYYRPRIEGLFARIERWTQEATGIIKWRVTTKDNQTTLFGWTDEAVIADPQDPRKIFEWLPQFVFDDKGNCCEYLYAKEDAVGIDPLLLHNRNRYKGSGITYTNRYLQKILYGNTIPYPAFEAPFPVEPDYLFSTVLDYGSLQAGEPVDTLHDWNFRADAFSDYKAGFEIRTTRLCKRILLYHHFRGIDEYDGLVKSLNVGYNTTAEQGFTFLQSLTTCGYIKKSDNSYFSKQMPAMEFTYQPHEWDATVKTITTANLVHAPAGLDEQQYQFTDLFNEGLSGILTEQANGWYYKHNLGNGHFEQAKLVSPKPAFTGLGGQLQLVDLDADGGKQLASLNTEPRGYFELNDDNEWLPYQYFSQLPNINMGDANTRMIDLNGDGLADVLITEDDVFTWYESAGRKGYTAVHKTLKPFDEEIGPAIVFADAQQTIFLADMSGDGLTDIARIRNGEICYWPNLGYGKFGSKVAMDNAPWFDSPDAFNPSYLRLADIDGSGTPDVIYLGKNKFSCWMNGSGNGFAIIPFEITAFPEIHNQAKVSVTDLLGNGVACIVWSSVLQKDAVAPLQYIDLMGSKKPHIMMQYRNNMGKEVSMEYTASTKYYIDDKLAGQPWITKLHFPVHCVSKTITEDKITRHRFASSYKYHHGYYDHAEREFRGFGMVEQFDLEQTEHWGQASGILMDETLDQKPVCTKSWVHTGAFLRNGKILKQFEQEYWYNEMNRQGFAITAMEHQLPEARIIDSAGNEIVHLTIDERREALRACKGMALRAEVFALDAPLVGATSEQLQAQLTPYTVAAHNCVIEMLQPKGNNKHAVFVVKESESITYHYERNITDPRIAHNLNIVLDEYGNILESASVVYPRRKADLSLPAATRQAQAKTVIIYSENQFTNDVINKDAYRLRLPAQVKTYQLKGVPITGGLYKPSDFSTILAAANEVEYHQITVEPVMGSVQKRLIEHIRSVYYRNNLTGALPLYQLESLALPYENYQLAYTPALVTDIFGTRVTDSSFGEGKFTHNQSDENWWVRSGTTQFINNTETVLDAQNRFYTPLSYTDPYGAVTTIQYYRNYALLIAATEDALGNTNQVERFNFRTLSPQRMLDINNNISEVLTDELGLVKAMAVMGKGLEADELTDITAFTEAAEMALVADFFQTSDSVQLRAKGKSLLKYATVRFVYDFEVYKNTGGPVVVASIAREEHYAKNNDAPVQLSFEYSNGLGKVVMKKVQAEPGLAKRVTVADDIVTITATDTSITNPLQLRWLGNGRTVLNNKGNPVKQYEPYFSITHQYEAVKELVESGVTPLLYYDALGRVTKTEMPDGTFSKVVFDAWQQKTYDANDTVLESDWYAKRIVLHVNHPERRAAEKAAKHYGTPTQMHLDSLGRPVLSIEHNKHRETGNDEYYSTSILLDTEGNLRSVTDARGNTVMQYKYDMLGNVVYQKSMDAGQRWLLTNIMGNPLRTWDERDHEFQYEYDPLHRPLVSKVMKGDGLARLNHVFDKIIYGESEPFAQAKNLRGQAVKHYDTGGLIETPEYDFKGQPISTTRYLFKDYKAVANWHTPIPADSLETEAFTFITETDALGRISKQTAPDGSIITPAYNEAGVLEREAVKHTGTAAAVTYIEEINYNEKGQRNFIRYGNGVKTTFEYDNTTFRLKHLQSDGADGNLQDLYYTYDATGNITRIEDKAIPVVFFNNQKIAGVAEYSYDALYRLIEANGRENAASLGFDKYDNWNDAAFRQELSPGTSIDGRNYTQQYQYDAVGNILQLQHIAAGNNWVRDYRYENNNNRLQTTQVGTQRYEYPHHPTHGYITVMPHLEAMDWNFKEELVKSIRQKRTDGGTPETTYYQYDGQGQRIRKITENQAAPNDDPTKKDERIYIAGYELYKKHSGTDKGLERTSLSLLEKEHRFVMVDTETKPKYLLGFPMGRTDPEQTVRYQLHNHLGSAALELDATAQIISYEEYHPFGTTAYQAINADIKAAAKRYRYTGMERDEETGLEYHSARYYLPWLGRWLSADPIGIGDGVNVYGYAKNKPLLLIDQKGKSGETPKQHKIEKGDTFWGLENKYHLSHGTLKNINKNIDEKKLAIGSLIKLPDKKSSSEEIYSKINPNTIDKIKAIPNLYDKVAYITTLLNPKSSSKISIVFTQELSVIEFPSVGKLTFDIQLPRQNQITYNIKMNKQGEFKGMELSINNGNKRLTIDDKGTIGINFALKSMEYSRIGIKKYSDGNIVKTMSNRNEKDGAGWSSETNIPKKPNNSPPGANSGLVLQEDPLYINKSLKLISALALAAIGLILSLPRAILTLIVMPPQMDKDLYQKEYMSL